MHGMVDCTVLYEVMKAATVALVAHAVGSAGALLTRQSVSQSQSASRLVFSRISSPLYDLLSSSLPTYLPTFLHTYLPPVLR
jgi:hypothetical protein